MIKSHLLYRLSYTLPHYAKASLGSCAIMAAAAAVNPLIAEIVHENAQMGEASLSHQSEMAHL